LLVELVSWGEEDLWLFELAVDACLLVEKDRELVTFQKETSILRRE
jgi:hypothetical protein